MSKRITIMGSTGSIGTNTLEVVRALGSDYRVVGLAARQRWAELESQCRAVEPQVVAIADPKCAEQLRRMLNGQVEVLEGEAGLVELAGHRDTDFVVAAIVGSAGLASTIAAVEAGRHVGLANKEALVMAGSLIVPLARQTGARLLPIDSKHSAIFQAMSAGSVDEVRKIYLTASGGPFRTWPMEKIASATPADALLHPTWTMGPKITVDSATMVNKAMEIIEAHWLFGIEVDAIEVVIHPESIVHSMVEFCDRSIIAQMGQPDMRTPIQYALTYPRRLRGCARDLDFSAIGQLRFEPPDLHRFPALRLGYEVARAGGTAGAVFNAANEAAVEAFLQGRIPFGRIVDTIREVLDRHAVQSNPNLGSILQSDAWARNEVKECLKS
ncbi:MAG: 1-deoxy-D-xylulose-5-phosphate reductoisomerase [Phycisphaerales bacterium]|nr:1-deoxy-D-xylulose-5-phosphate reductoisomerase [Phycisphaerales bacterium]